MNEGDSLLSPPPILTRGWKFAVILSVGIAFCIPITMFHVLDPMRMHIPSWDQWHLVPIWDAYYSGGNIWTLMFQPYAGHLNIIPRFIFLGNVIISHWDVRWEMNASFVVAGGTLCIFLSALSASDRRLLVLAAPVSAQVFSTLQFENFMSAYPLGQNISQFAGTAAVYFATLRTPRRLHIFVAGAGAFIATFSWGAGLVAWYMVIMALLLRKPIKISWLSGVIIAAAICTGLVFRSGSSRPAPDLQKIGEFFLVLLGKPITLVPSAEPHQCAVAGALLLTATCIIFIWTLKSRLLETALRWGVFALFAIASAALITIGRYESGPQQALASHYVTAVYPLVVAAIAAASACLLQLYDRLCHSLARVGTSAALAVVSLIVFAQALVVDTRIIPMLQGWSKDYPEFEKKLIAETETDDEIHKFTHPDASLVRWSTQALRRHHLSVFANPSMWPSNLSTPAIPMPLSALPSTEIALDTSAFAVTWGTVAAPSDIQVDAPAPVSVTVTNASSSAWPVRTSPGSLRANGDFAVRMGYRWVGGTDGESSYDGHRIDFPHSVAPGTSITLLFNVNSPHAAGDYTLQLGLLQERVTWFEDKGAPTARVPVRVNEAAPSFAATVTPKAELRPQ
ncbi:MAG: hypothetical protein ACR2MF_00690 [Chthoniobacterales bacterium]